MMQSLSLSLLLLVLPSGASASTAGTARWVAETARWGTLTVPARNAVSANDEVGNQHDDQFVPNEWNDISANVFSMAASKEHNGRIFFYLMHQTTMEGAALTVSQASFEPKLFAVAGCGDPSNAVDAQDPRCAKVTFSGKIVPCDNECDIIAKQALFSAHPSMEYWPEDHDFQTHEMILDSVWMIANFGGGDVFSAEEYYQANPSPHQITDGENVMHLPYDNHDTKIPDWNNTVARSRWITHHSRWGTVSSTEHNNEEGEFFGNIRSVTDGPYCESSTGRPVFQFPDVDPIAKDMAHTGNKIALTFSEASIAARVKSDTGAPCGGDDAGSPTCGKVILYGHAAPIDPSSIKFRHVLDWFKETHPLAPWLSQGGSHMKGKYYTIHIHKVVILDYFGGYQEVEVGDYLQYDMSERAGEYCQGYSSEFSASAKSPFQVFSTWFFVLGVSCLLASIWFSTGRKTRQSYQYVVETTSVA